MRGSQENAAGEEIVPTRVVRIVCAGLLVFVGAVVLNDHFGSYGLASFYGCTFHNKETASGEVFDMYAMTAAHRRLPFGTIVEVENLANCRAVEVRINDRGPFIPGRIIDISRAAAKELGMVRDGVVAVRLRTPRR